jgi:nitrite reductase (NADH) small subunit
MSAPAPTYPLGRLDEIPLGEGRVFRVDGRDIAVFRCRSGEVHATDAACPHRGGPLADGLVGESTVVCPLHGCVFDLRTGAATGRDCHQLAVMRVTVSRAGELALDVS